MSINLIIIASIFCVAIMIFICYLIAVKKIRLKYGLVWLILFFLLLLLILIPGLLEAITQLLGFQTASNMILCAIIGLLVILSIVNTVAISTLSKQNRILTQELAIYKQEKKESK